MQKNRFDQLEGLRGIAAVVVAIYHFLLAFYLFAFFGPNNGMSVQNMRFEDNLHGSPFAVFLSGTFAVAIFFVLSGFVLSIGFFQSGKIQKIKNLAAKRYLRLMIPALASTLICFLVITLGLFSIQEAGSITHSYWLVNEWQFNPNLIDALKSGMYDIFMQEGSPFNNALWTMKIEFIGSFIVFGFLLLFGKAKHRWLAYTFLFIGTFNTWFFAFIAGMVMADIYAQGKLVEKKRSAIFVAPVLICSLYLGGYPVIGAEGTVFYGIFSTVSELINWKIMLISLGAVGLLSLILLTEQLGRFFAHKVVSVTGRYTFSLYLIHMPVIYTVGLAVFLFSYQVIGVGYNVSVLFAFVAFSLVTFYATLLFEKYIDSRSITISSKVARIFLGEEEVKIDRGVISGRLAAFVSWYRVSLKQNSFRSAEEPEE